MESPSRPNRTRTRNLVVRLTDSERKMLDRVTKKLGLPSVSATFRYLLQREDRPRSGA